jgi:hypothetical protein
MLALEVCGIFKVHIDIVPAIPDNYGWILEQGVPMKYAKHSINITDNELKNYDVHSFTWPKSNTEGYALWFLDIMKIEADKIRMFLKAELLLESIDDVPEYKIRTPLQRGVQLMKRHRDIMFNSDCDKPISIIITTLATRAYEFVLQQNENLVFYDVLLRIVDAMPLFIEKRNGNSWIPNPVNPKENFADKWNEEKVKEIKFYEWHSAFKKFLN